MERELTDPQDTEFITPNVTGNQETPGAPAIERIQRLPPRARTGSTNSTVTEDSSFNPRQLSTTTDNEALATFLHDVWPKRIYRATSPPNRYMAV